MENTQLIKVLRSFSVREGKRWIAFIHSPYFNTNDTLSRLAEELWKAAPDFTGKRVEREHVFSKLFPGQRFDDVKLRTLVSLLLSLTEQFIAEENRQASGINDVSFLLNAFNRRSLDHQFLLLAEKQHGKFRGNDPGRWEDLNQYMIRAEILSEKLKLINSRKEKITEATEFTKGFESLDAFYIGEILRYGTQLKMFNLSIAVDTQILEQVEVKVSAFSGIIEASPMLRLLKLCYDIADGFDLLQFTELKQKVFTGELRHLIREDAQTAFDLLANFIDRKALQGDTSLNALSLQIHKKQEEFGFHLVNGHVEEIFFSNSVVMAMKAGELQWAKEFVRRNEAYLSPAIRNNTVHYSLGSIAETEKDFKRALFHLNKVESPSLQIGINIRGLLVKIYFDKGDMVMVMNTCKSFLKFMNTNKKITGEYREVWVNFIRNAILLAKVHLGKKQLDLEEWIERTEQTGKMVLKGWLLKKARTMKDQSPL